MRLALLVLASCVAAFAAERQEERLRYSVNWPSGLSLGEGSMRAGPLQEPPEAMEYSLVLDAAIPGITIRDEYKSQATAGYCSLEFQKSSEHGTRKSSERSLFDLAGKRVTRTTSGGGGKSEASTPACAKDALTFLYFLRREVSLGRVPPSQTIYFGAAYQMTLAYTGGQQITAGGAGMTADRFTVALKGPASENTFEIWLARDAARTPVLIRVPFSMGTFSMELVR